MIDNCNELVIGDCLLISRDMPENSIDGIVTDPPYGLSFRGAKWDRAVPGPEYWAAFLRICKPGAYLLAFGGTRTYHRLACAIEDAGWTLKDCLMWLYGSGFPKNHDIGKAIDKAAGAEREVIGYTKQGARSIFDGGKPRAATLPATLPAMLWDGYGTALKPSWEPIILAQKPLDGTYAQNVLRWGVGGLNIGASRIGIELIPSTRRGQSRNTPFCSGVLPPEHSGRWPANLLLDEEAAMMLDAQSGLSSSSWRPPDKGGSGKSFMVPHKEDMHRGHNDFGGASRFFWVAKASPSERDDFNDHPTVKPIALLRYLIRLIAPPDPGTILDPFAGSGSTLVACQQLGVPFMGIELDEKNAGIARDRLNKRILPLFEEEIAAKRMEQEVLDFR